MSQVLDTKGLNCPLPVLKARKAMRSLRAGERLTVLATDPASPIDFHHFADTSGHALVEESINDGVFTFVLEKATDA